MDFCLAPDAGTDNDGTLAGIEIGINLDAPLNLDGDGRIDALEPRNSSNDASQVNLLRLAGGYTVNISTDVDQSLSNITVSELTEPPAGIIFRLAWSATQPAPQSVAGFGSG